MIKFDHLRIPVTDLPRSREWYIRTLGMTVEFEMPDRQTVALQDTDGSDPPWCRIGARCGFKSGMSTPRSPTGPARVSPSLMAPARPTGARAPSLPILTAT